MWYSPKYILDSVIGFTEKLRYQKPTAFYGLRFEEWVVRWSNIKVKCSKNYEPYWILKDWRGDKSYFRHCIDKPKEGDTLENKNDGKETKSKRYKIIPKSSLAPDLTLVAVESEKRRSWKPGTEIYVECKWTQKGVFYLKKESIKHYDDFLTEVLPDFSYTDRLGRLFFVFGVGWDTLKGQPKKAYCVRANNLYMKLNEMEGNKMPLEYGWQTNCAREDETLEIHYSKFKEKDIGGIELIKDTGKISIYYK